MKYLSLSVLLVSVFIMGCQHSKNPQSPLDKETVPAENSAASISSTPSVVKPLVAQKTSSAIYTDFSEKALQSYRGKKVVLYFFADWCPYCHTFREELTEALPTFPQGAIVLRVNYDEREDLRKKYGIRSQHSSVFLDENGDVVRANNFRANIDDISDFFTS